VVEVGKVTAGLYLDQSAFDRGLSQAEGKAHKFGSALGTALKAGAAVGIAATAAAVIGGTNAFATYEQGLASVSKTTGLVGDDLKALGSDLRQLSTEGPVTVSMLEDIAGAAGSLGIGVSKMASGDMAGARAEIVSFTKVMSDMAIAFEMDAGPVSTQMAGIANVFKIPTENLNILGSQINALENQMNATAPGIIDFVNAFGGTATMWGEPAAATAAFGATLASLGVDGPQAATAIKAGLNMIASDGDKMAAMADIMGISVESLSQKMGDDLYGTLIEMGGAINMVEGDVERMGAATDIFGTYGYQALAKAGIGADMYAEALGYVNVQGTELTAEAGVMANTLTGQWQRMKNSIFDVGISIGEITEGPFKNLLNWLNTGAIPAIKNFVVSLASGTANLKPLWDGMAAAAIVAFALMSRGAVLAAARVVASFVTMGAGALASAGRMAVGVVASLAGMAAAGIASVVAMVAPVVAGYATMATGAISRIVAMKTATIAAFVTAKAQALSNTLLMVSSVLASYATMAVSSVASVVLMAGSVAVQFVATKVTALASMAIMAAGVIAHYARMALGAAASLAGMVAKTIAGFALMAAGALAHVARMAAGVVASFVMMAAGAAAPVLALLAPVLLVGAAIGGMVAAFGGIDKTGVIDSLKKVGEAVKDIWESLKKGDYKTAFSKLTTYAKSAKDQITGYFGSLDWKQAFSSAGDILITTFTAAYGKLRDLGGYLAEGFRNIDWGGVWDEVKGLGTSIVDSLKSVNWSSIASTIGAGLRDAFGTLTDIGAAIVEKLKAIDWRSAGDTILGLIGQGFGALSDIGEKLFDALTSYDWSSLVSRITSGLADIGGAIGGYIKEKLAAVEWGEVGTRILDGIKAVFGAASDLGTYLSEAIEKYDWSPVGEKIAEWLKVGIQAEWNLLKWIGEKVSGITTSDATNTFSGWFSAVVSAFSEFWAGFSDEMTGGAGWKAAFVNLFWDAFDKVSSVLSGWAGNVYNSLRSHIIGWLTQVDTFSIKFRNFFIFGFDAVLIKLGEWYLNLSGLLDDAFSKIETTFEGITGIEFKWPAIPEFISGPIDTAISKLGSLASLLGLDWGSSASAAFEPTGLENLARYDPRAFSNMGGGGGSSSAGESAAAASASERASTTKTYTNKVTGVKRTAAEVSKMRDSEKANYSEDAGSVWVAGANYPESGGMVDLSALFGKASGSVTTPMENPALGALINPIGLDPEQQLENIKKWFPDYQGSNEELVAELAAIRQDAAAYTAESIAQEAATATATGAMADTMPTVADSTAGTVVGISALGQHIEAGVSGLGGRFTSMEKTIALASSQQAVATPQPGQIVSRADVAGFANAVRYAISPETGKLTAYIGSAGEKLEKLAINGGKKVEQSGESFADDVYISSNYFSGATVGAARQSETIQLGGAYQSRDVLVMGSQQASQNDIASSQIASQNVISASQTAANNAVSSSLESFFNMQSGGQSVKLSAEHAAQTAISSAISAGQRWISSSDESGARIAAGGVEAGSQITVASTEAGAAFLSDVKLAGQSFIDAIKSAISGGGSGGGDGCVGGTCGSSSGALVVGNSSNASRWAAYQSAGLQTNYNYQTCLGSTVPVNALIYTNPAGYSYSIDPMNYHATGGISSYISNTSGVRLGSYAEGGVVDGPQLAVVGDNPSGREAIIPEEVWGGKNGNGGSQTIIVQLDSRVIAKAVGNRQMKEIRVNAGAKVH